MILYPILIDGVTFLDLDDTPTDYTGEGSKFVRVKTDVSGLEFVTGTGGVSNLIELDDTPANYAGSAGKFLVVKNDVSGIEFTDTISLGNSI